MNNEFLKLFNLPLLRRGSGGGLLLALALFAGCASETAQITMTVTPDESGVMKFYASAQQLVVNWGDGQTETFTNVADSGISHTYAARTAYTVRISETQLTKLGDQYPCYIEDALKGCSLTAYMAGNIKQLYIDGCPTLKGVVVAGSDPDRENSGTLTDLEINNCPTLQDLRCDYNQLTSLDVSSLTALQRLECDYNQLVSLDVSSNTALQDLHCERNPLTSLDASGCTALKYLYCHNNQLTSLDVSSNTALKYLHCERNQLTSLDVSGCTALQDLLCYDNPLISLDVSSNTALRNLECRDNQLTASALNAIFAALPDRTGDEDHGYTGVRNNPGSGECDKSIAENKNWRIE